MTVHNYKWRQVHKTLNGLNPSSSFRDMHSAKSGPKFLARSPAWTLTPISFQPRGLRGKKYISLEQMTFKITNALLKITIGFKEPMINQNLFTDHKYDPKLATDNGPGMFYAANDHCLLPCDGLCVIMTWKWVHCWMQDTGPKLISMTFEMSHLAKINN